MIKGLTIFLWCCAAAITAKGQDIAFSSLTTENGLSDNFIQSIITDKNGFLWIGTYEGLNSYDGYSITQYSLDDNPEIPSKTVVNLVCDKNNYIWLASNEGAAYADQKRKFHRVLLEDSIKNYRCNYIAETASDGIILFTSRGNYVHNRKSGKWEKAGWNPVPFDYYHISEVYNYDEDKLLISTDSLALLLDYKTHKVIFNKPLLNVQSLCRAENGNIALSFSNGLVKVINPFTDITVREYDLSSFRPGVNARSVWSEIRYAPDGSLLVATGLFGFFIIDKNGHITRPVHDPVNPSSIVSEQVWRVFAGEKGDVVLGTPRKGISIFNVLRKKAGHERTFVDKNADFYDGLISEIAIDRDGSVWMGAIDRLIHWDKKNKKTSFYQYYGPQHIPGATASTVNRVLIDHLGQLWVNLAGWGPALFNRQTGQFSLLPADTTITKALKGKYLFTLFESGDRQIWAGGISGFYTIDPVSKKITGFDKHPVLKDICLTRTYSFAEDSRHRIWISGNGAGVYCFDPAANTLRQYGKKDGLISDESLDLICSSSDDIYVSMRKGFNIIHPDGRIAAYTRATGLRYDKVDAFVEDNEKNIWISNAKCIYRFRPSSEKFDLFDEHENFNLGGFMPYSAVKAPDGELILGTQSGVNYFYPSDFTNSPEPLRVSIYQVQAGDSTFHISGNESVSLAYKNNNLQFYFAAVTLLGSQNIRYEYKLEGHDAEWQEGTDIRQARYSSLPPGPYKFLVRASINRKDWTESSNSFTFSIIAPLRMRWWFRALAVLTVAGLLLFIYARRSRQLRQKREELETEQAVNYFASSLHQQQTTDEILWDVARNCIGRLQFEDCVIYLLDENTGMLIQKAAYGPKSPRSFEIEKPLDIPLGKGIVGSVAVTQKAEIIHDTSKDSRYIADDAVRLSEITVPIVADNKVIGVIDCEHSKKGFFTQKHLSILTTIASLCASKIVRGKTEAEKREAEKMLAETKHKMAEAEMQALRAQMNPHFIFNCLNSINRYIVKSDQATASLYLTRFAKLIRLILDNSHSKYVILSNEIEALRLYIEMESLRFDHKFSYEIITDPGLPADTIEIPPLIIQPYVENAIWHGLLHKPEAGYLRVHISLAAANVLQCSVEDNGVGREKAAELKSKSVTKKKSLGMELTENRLLLLNEYAAVHSSVTIDDLKDDSGNATGTLVTLKIPFGDS